MHAVSLHHCKKMFVIFPSPAGMSLTKLSLGGNNDVIYKLFPPRESLVSDISAGDGKIVNLFLQCAFLFGRWGGGGVEHINCAVCSVYTRIKADIVQFCFFR